MQLAPAAFNRLNRIASQLVNWRKGALCPCRSLSSGSAKPGCPACSGRGVLWNAPAGEAWCFPAGMRVQRQWREMGQFESGDTVVQIASDSPLYECGEYDRVLMKQSTEPFEAVLTYTGSETLGWPTVCIDSVFWLDPVTQAPVLGGIPTADACGVISWTDVVGGPVPPAGIQYSMSGRRIPEYFVFGDLPRDRAHFRGAALPRLTTLRKFDLFGR